ncbi:MAG: ABC transporter substrate-binding protein [Thermodesulfobacteriota bacterium]|nr:ABC transporter substrate-binding protein [Thermodesulfobacteriota bacterium]
MGKIVTFVVLLYTVFFLISPGNDIFAGTTRGIKGDTLIIGIIMDQTGPASDIGVAYAAGIRNYFRNTNETGGINGRKIKLILEDDGYSMPRAIAAFKKLVFRDKVLMILGCGGTGQNTALFPQIKKYRVPTNTVSWSWTMNDPVNKYVFTPGNDNKDEIKVIMDYIVKTMKAKDPRIALVSADVECGKSGFRVAEAKAKEYNVDLVGREILPIGVLDASTQVLSLRKKKATHVITMITVGMSLALLKSAKTFNYDPIFFGTFHFFGDEVVEIARERAKSMYGVAAFGSWFDDNSGIVEMKRISLKYHPNMEPPNRYYIKGWITSKITYEGIKRSGKDLTPDRLVDALESIKDLDMKGLTGPINYSPKNHKGNSYARLYKADIDKGYFVPVTEWTKPE